MADSGTRPATAVRALDLAARTSTIYPPPFDKVTAGRTKRALGTPFGLTQFGVNLVHLAPGAATALRHWHRREDEFIYVLDGEVTLVTDEGESPLEPGMIAGFPAGVPNGHCLVNRGTREAVLLEVGTRSAEETACYPDHDLVMERSGGSAQFTRSDGTPYEGAGQ